MRGNVLSVRMDTSRCPVRTDFEIDVCDYRDLSAELSERNQKKIGA